MDRDIKVWDLTIRKPTFGLTSSGGFVYSSDISPVDPNLVAFGVGDGMFRVWNTQIEPTFVQTVWQGVKEKVTALAWHRTELKLAFGTEHGKVGMWNSNNNKVVNSDKYHKKIVYSISFLGDEVLSCAGDGMVIKHDSSMNSGKLFDIESNGKFRHCL